MDNETQYKLDWNNPTTPFSEKQMNECVFCAHPIQQREVLEQQQRERYDTDFRGTCMFCGKEFTGNRLVSNIVLVFILLTTQTPLNAGKEQRSQN